MSLREYVKAKEYQEKALAIAEKIGDREAEAECYVNLGYVFLSLREYVKAKECLQKALEIAQKIGFSETEVVCYRSLGIVFTSLGEYVKAKEYQERALAIAEKNGDRKTIAQCYLNLGGLFQSLGEYIKDKEYQEKALAIAEEIGDRETEASCYANLGTVFESLFEYVKAKEYQEKALAIAEQIGDRETETECYRSLGRVFKSLGEYVKAKEYQEKALAIAEKNDNKITIPKCYLHLGSVLQSIGEYVKAKEYQEKALAMAEKIGERKTEASCYANLGVTFHSLSEYVKAKEYQEKALEVAQNIGDREAEAASYGNLGRVFMSLGEDVKAKEYVEKALVIAEKIGHRETEAMCYEILGSILLSLGEYVKAEEYQEKALAIAEEIGDRKREASCYVNLGGLSLSLREYVKAKEYQEKALEISEKIGDRVTEAACCGNLGTVFLFLGEYVKAKEYQEKALVLSREIGDVNMESEIHWLISLRMMVEDHICEAKSHLFAYINKKEVIRCFLKDHEQFSISYLDQFGNYYRSISHWLCLTGNPCEGLYTEEIGRARALADLMSSQYSIENEISVNPQAWAGIKRIVKKEHNSACLYISYSQKFINLWVIKADNQLLARTTDVNDCFAGNGPVSEVADVFCTEVFRQAHCLAPEQCEDRSWFPSNAQPHRTRKSTQENSLIVSRLLEEDEDNQPPILTLADGYKMIIAPVADSLDKTEIIFVPDRLFFTVPFAALKDEKGKYLSESFKIRIVPSLATLKLIQDSPADFHSQTGALIVGDPEVGEVLYKGDLLRITRLPFASEEAEMVGKLLGTQPLLGKKAKKETVLKSIHSVSLIHFAAHGDAERGEIVLAPPPRIGRKPQEEDYLLTMADISQIRLRAKLVVLSCCHSAKGQIRTEGVVGIARAFLGSGARSVLVALWAIQDEATKQFMSRFYEHLGDGESASESLH